jgi:hypothetical protein
MSQRRSPVPAPETTVAEQAIAVATRLLARLGHHARQVATDVRRSRSAARVVRNLRGRGARPARASRPLGRVAAPTLITALLVAPLGAAVFAVGAVWLSLGAAIAGLPAPDPVAGAKLAALAGAPATVWFVMAVDRRGVR